MRGTPQERERRVKLFLNVQAAMLGATGVVGLFVFPNAAAAVLILMFALVEVLFVRFYRGPWVRN